jgi:hypothetical protein
MSNVNENVHPNQNHIDNKLVTNISNKNADSSISLNDSALSEFQMIDVSDHNKSGSQLVRGVGCLYPSFRHCDMDNHDSTSWLQMDKLSEVSQSLCTGGLKSIEDLDASNVSAVRISQQVSLDYVLRKCIH